MKKSLFVFIFLILALNVLAVDQDIVNEIQSNGEVDVVVILNDNTNVENFQYDEKLKDLNGFVVNVDLKELSDIISKGGVKDVDLNIPFSIALSESVPMIGASSVQNYGIYGSGSVCLLDTGVDYTHTLLGGCTNDTFIDGTCGKIVGGYDFINNDNDPIDDNGHGTHVAGIIAANGSLIGVAPGAKIVAVKVLDNTGYGNESHILEGLNFCIENAVKYNIKVISMSFSANNLYEGVCDDVLSSLTEKMNEAIINNITVIAASGNQGNSGSLALPACISNVTSVGAVDKSNLIAGFSNRNNLLSLLAPGVNIRSSALGGGEVSKSGTSMAVPEVAGALMLIQDMLLPQQLVDLLKQSGVEVFDESSNLTYPRLDIYNALVQMDDVLPELTLIKPVNKTYFESVPLEYSVGEFSPYDVYYYLNGIRFSNNTALTTNEGSYDFVLCANQTSNGLETCTGMNFSIGKLTVVGPINGQTYTNKNISIDYSVSNNIKECWYSLDNGQNNVTLDNCLDSSFIANEGNQNLIFYVKSLDDVEYSQLIPFSYQPVKPNVILGLPDNNGWVLGTGTLNCNATDDNLLNLLLYVDNELQINVGSNVLSFGVNSFSQNTNHTWNCYGIDADGFEDWGDSNRTFAIDTVIPTVLISSHANNDVIRGASFSLSYNVTENIGLSSCKLYVNNVESNEGGKIINDGNSVTVNTATDGDYNLVVKCTDFAGNTGSSSSVKIKKVTETTPEKTATTKSAGGGGGGASGDESDEEANSDEEVQSEDAAITGNSIAGNPNLVQYREEGSTVVESGVEFSGFYFSSLESEEQSSGITGFFVQGYDAVFGKEEENRTTVEFNFTNNGESDLENFAVYSEVPKTFSEDASEIEVSAEDALVEVVEVDPVFKLVYDTVAKGETKIVGYTVQKTVDQGILGEFTKPDFVTEAVKAGKSYLGWYLFISIGVLVLILVLFLGKNFDRFGGKFFNFKYAVKDKVENVKHEAIEKTKSMPKVQKVVSKMEPGYDEELPDTLHGKKFE